MNKIPSKIVMEPKIIESTLEDEFIFEPNEPKIAPYEINNAENPNIKSIEPRATRLLRFKSVIPAAYERYPGTNGRTQGEKNEIRPAINETKIANSIN